MPFKSEAQQRFAYAHPEKFGGKAGLAEWSAATDFSKLPRKLKNGKAKLLRNRAAKKSTNR